MSERQAALRNEGNIILAAMLEDLRAKLQTANAALICIKHLPIAVAPDGGPCDRCSEAHDIARIALATTNP